MRRFENLTYLFVGVAIGFMLFATTTGRKIHKEYSVIRIAKTDDFTDCAVDSEKKYYEHLYNSK